MQKSQNCSFSCLQCGISVVPVTNGSFRNHCPNCLYSLCVDDLTPGDRASNCHSLMEPKYLLKVKKGYQILHQCRGCKKITKNIVAVDSVDADQINTLVKLRIITKGELKNVFK